jgi:hypothetical protein
MSYPRTDIHKAFLENPKSENETPANYINHICKITGERYHVIYKQYVRHYNNLQRSKATYNKQGQLVSETLTNKPIDEIENLEGYEANKLTTNPYGGQWVRYEKKQVDYIKAVADLLEAYNPKQVLPPIKATKPQKKALKCTLSDIHIGLSTKNDLFGYKYDKDAIKRSFAKVWEAISSRGEFELIILQDLGDSLDGYNAMTTRGGHSLQQDMTNIEAFDLIVSLKLDLLQKIQQSGLFGKCVMLSASNCNHSGDFGYFANQAVGIVANKVHGVECHNYDSFIGAYTYGEHTFLSCHGKDKLHMKSGLPIKLDDRTKSFIMSYVNRYGIASKYLHFEKGDLHQLGYSKCKEFDYRNFMSFAPPSNWVQHNFGDTYSGFSIQVIDKNSPNIQHTDYFLNYDNN